MVSIQARTCLDGGRPLQGSDLQIAAERPEQTSATASVENSLADYDTLLEVSQLQPQDLLSLFEEPSPLEYSKALAYLSHLPRVMGETLESEKIQRKA